jgi:hypothetical protein
MTKKSEESVGSEALESLTRRVTALEAIVEKLRAQVLAQNRQRRPQGSASFGG